MFTITITVVAVEKKIASTNNSGYLRLVNKGFVEATKSFPPCPRSFGFPGINAKLALFIILIPQSGRTHLT